jgi:hypothetical protein
MPHWGAAIPGMLWRYAKRALGPNHHFIRQKFLKMGNVTPLESVPIGTFFRGPFLFPGNGKGLEKGGVMLYSAWGDAKRRPKG